MLRLRFAFDLQIALPLHHAERHLPVVGLIAQEIAARGFALDEAGLRQLVLHDEIVVVRPKEPGADGVDDAQRLEPHLGGDAAIAHAEQPAAGFFLQRLVKFGFTGHGAHSFARGTAEENRKEARAHGQAHCAAVQRN